jgi:hypothetical protein
MLDIRRRQLITLLGGAAAAWPRAARAQQTARRRITVFMPGVADDPEYAARCELVVLPGLMIGHRGGAEGRCTAGSRPDLCPGSPAVSKCVPVCPRKRTSDLRGNEDSPQLAIHSIDHAHCTSISNEEVGRKFWKVRTRKHENSGPQKSPGPNQRSHASNPCIRA